MKKLGHKSGFAKASEPRAAHNSEPGRNFPPDQVVVAAPNASSADGVRIENFKEQRRPGHRPIMRATPSDGDRLYSLEPAARCAQFDGHRRSGWCERRGHLARRGSSTDCAVSGGKHPDDDGLLARSSEPLSQSRLRSSS